MKFECKTAAVYKYITVGTSISYSTLIVEIYRGSWLTAENSCGKCGYYDIAHFPSIVQCRCPCLYHITCIASVNQKMCNIFTATVFCILTVLFWCCYRPNDQKIGYYRKHRVEWPLSCTHCLSHDYL